MDLTLTPIAPFDARRGYRRWCLPGVGVRMGDRPQAVADIWEDREGRLVIRFESLGYQLHFEIRSKGGRKIVPADEAAIADFLDGKLQQWIIDGVDDDLE